MVLIPNGMEFYGQAKIPSINAEVLIPNGMEFYAKRRATVASAKRFNSQRDGILQHEFCHFSR